MFLDVLVVLKLLILIKTILESSGHLLSAMVALRLLAMMLRGENA
jgi:hypothetical protein